MVLDVTHLMQLDVTHPSTVSRSSCDLRAIDFDEVSRFSRDPRLELDASMASRLLTPHDICFAAIIDGRLAGYYWLAFGSIEAEHNRGELPASGVAIAFPSDAAFAYKAFIHPDFRGLGLYGDVVRSAGNWLRQTRGTTRIVSTADWTNYAALRSCTRQGFASMGLIWRFGWNGNCFTYGPSPEVSRGITFGDQAKLTCKRSNCSTSASDKPLLTTV